MAFSLRRMNSAFAAALACTSLWTLSGCVAHNRKSCEVPENCVGYPDSLYYGYYPTCWKPWPEGWGCAIEEIIEEVPIPADEQPASPPHLDEDLIRPLDAAPQDLKELPAAESSPSDADVESPLPESESPVPEDGDLPSSVPDSEADAPVDAPLPESADALESESPAPAEEATDEEEAEEDEDEPRADASPQARLNSRRYPPARPVEIDEPKGVDEGASEDEAVEDEAVNEDASDEEETFVDEEAAYDDLGEMPTSEADEDSIDGDESEWDSAQESEPVEPGDDMLVQVEDTPGESTSASDEESDGELEPAAEFEPATELDPDFASALDEVSNVEPASEPEAEMILTSDRQPRHLFSAPEVDEEPAGAAVNGSKWRRSAKSRRGAYSKH